jgi:hypothetical protein
MGRGCVHLLGERHRREIPAELFCLLDIGHAVLPVGGGKADDGRDVAEGVEEAVGREVDIALGVAGGDPADRSRRDDGVERIVLQPMALGRFIVMDVSFCHLASPLLAVIARSQRVRLSEPAR